jgi:hypothetical protein
MNRDPQQFTFTSLKEKNRFYQSGIYESHKAALIVFYFYFHSLLSLAQSQRRHGKAVPLFLVGI